MRICNCLSTGSNLTKIKESYTTRKRAQAEAKRFRKETGIHVRAYPCPEKPGYWHIGKLQQKVLQRGLPYNNYGYELRSR